MGGERGRLDEGIERAGDVNLPPCARDTRRVSRRRRLSKSEDEGPCGLDAPMKWRTSPFSSLSGAMQSRLANAEPSARSVRGQSR